jgi:alkylhydroperoxidase family enzyme
MATIASSTLASRARVAPGARALSPSAAAPLAASRPRGSLVIRADGGSGINFGGFPYIIARKAGFDTSEGIAGFTPFAELFVGRTAMGGFATGIAQEFITGDGILAQLGVKDLPNEQIFDFFVATLALSAVAGVWVTFRQLVAGEMSPKQFKRYQRFLGLTGQDEAARLNATREAQEKDIDGQFLATEFKAVAAAAVDGPGPSMSIDEDPKLTPRQQADGSMAYLKSVELSNARWAMVGFAAAVVIERRRASRCSISS